MKNFYKIMFLNLMTIGTLITLSSLSWLTAWIGLEINLLALMPLMKEFNNKYSSEATIKYFIVQAMASAMLLFSVIIFSQTKTYSFINNIPLIPSILINSALLLKLGAAPFHAWFPEVISGMSWEMCFILLTWQKIAPMALLTYSIYTPMFLSIIIIFSSIIAGLQGMNQVCLRKVMAYSSINHVGWMISALMNSITIWTYYFIIYCIINLNIILILNKYNIFYMNQLNKLFSFNKKLKFMFMLNFLSLGGLPPFMGFFPKWLTINHLVNSNYYTLSFILIIFTLISLYFYLRITFSSFILNYSESLTLIFKKVNFFHMFMNFMALTGLMFCTFMCNFF